MLVEVFFKTQKLLGATVSAKGLLEESRTLEPGMYDAVFHVGQWYREQRVALPAVPFLDVVTYRFGISDGAQHYHLPFKCTPWGYSCFRGGA
jgi:5-hydroxyisourate hydrolase